MARYRCDLCNHRKKTKWGADICKRHDKVVPQDAIDPPDFCYVWQYHKDEVRTRWYKKGKFVND